MKKYILLIYIALIGTLIGSATVRVNSNVWYGQYLSLLFVVYTVSIFVLWRFNKFLSLFLASCVFSTFFISGISPRAVVLLTQLESLSLISYGISKLNQKQRKCVTYAFLIVFIIQGILLILQLLNRDFLFSSLLSKTRNELVGFMGSPDQLGSSQAIITPILVFISPYLFVPSLLILFTSKSFFAVVSSFVGMGIYVYLNFPRKIFKYYVILILIVGAYYCCKVDTVNLTQVRTRLDPWSYAAKSVLKGRIDIVRNNSSVTLRCNPLFGFGFGNFLTTFPFVPKHGTFNYSNEKFTHAHNDLVEILFENGLVGFILLLLLILSVILGFKKSRKNIELTTYFSCVTIYVLNMCGNFISQIALLGLYLSIIYGMYEGTRRELNGPNTSMA